MSKELEALEIIEDERYALPILRDFDDAVAIVRKALTPPTSDEVCKALSEYFGERIGNVFYVEKTKIFRSEAYVNLGEYLFDSEYLDKIPPHLITMIGKFYESLDVQE